ncbi:MAG: aldehyde dehydrogenase family protein [Actinomycetota bacterium]
MAPTKTRRRKKPATLKSMNPQTGALLGEVAASTPQEVHDGVIAGRKVQAEWAAIGPQGRARHLGEVRHAIYRHLDDIVETIAQECGKPRAEALAHDIMPTVLGLQYMAHTAPKWLRSDRPGGVVGPILGLTSRVDYRPFGVVGCIAPWNYPFLLSFMGVIPALLAGNTVVLKPSEVTPGVGERIREILEPLPSGVATVVQGAGDIGAALVDARCDKLCFIGSPATGRKIAAAAAKHLTPVVMELGGQDAAIVCEDADLDLASSGVLWGAFLNAGQACTAVERAYVADSVADRFVDALVQKLSRLRQDGGGDIGSMTTPDQLDVFERHLTDAVDKGARVVAGGREAGKRNDDGTLWAYPTILEGRSEDMAVFAEETFGPLLPIVRVRDDDEAIRRANHEGFNLTASVWSGDRSRARRIASYLRSGTVTINCHAEAAGTPWAAWGGVGESGYGRLNGVYGMREFTVPTHVGTHGPIEHKRLFWYPYGEATTDSLRAVTELFSAPSAGTKLRAARRLAGSIGKAMKEKL